MDIIFDSPSSGISNGSLDEIKTDPFVKSLKPFYMVDVLDQLWII